MDDKTLVERQMVAGDIHAGTYADLNRQIEAQATRIEALEARLEIEPSHPYDGIYARDETIRLLEQRIEALETEKRKLALDLLAALGQAADALEDRP